VGSNFFSFEEDGHPLIPSPLVGPACRQAGRVRVRGKFRIKIFYD